MTPRRRPFPRVVGRSRHPPAAPAERSDDTDQRPVRRDLAASVINNAVYADGHRVASPSSLLETFEVLRDTPDTMAWIGLYRPDADQFGALAREFGLHELAVEDAVTAHQRPKLERYGETLFVVLRTARYVDQIEEVDFGEVHVFIGPDFVITVRHSEAPDLASARRRMENDPELLRRGPEAVLYAILDEVVDRYQPVLDGLDNDVEEIETQVFRGDPSASRRIYELTREVIEFQRAARSLAGMLDGLSRGFGKYRVDEELQRYLRDVADHNTLVVERLDGLRQLLQNILTVNATLVGQQQNEEMKSLTEASFQQNEQVKKISAWAAILFAPTLIGTVYGMNFDPMPELGWAHGYPLALGMMAGVCLGLYMLFRRRDWL
jgi:magnesium transporter